MGDQESKRTRLGSVAATRFTLTAHDPITFVVVSLVLIGGVLLAVYLLAPRKGLIRYWRCVVNRFQVSGVEKRLNTSQSPIGN